MSDRGAAGILIAALLLGVPVIPSEARGEEAATESAKEAARAAYALGERAIEAESYDRAAAEFARADALVPNESALRAALEAVGRGTNPSLAVHLLRRARARPSPHLDAAVRLVEGRYASTLGRLRIDCPPTTACTATVGGDAVPIAEEVWATRGEHRIEGSIGGEPARDQTVVIGPTEIVSVTLEPSAPSDEPTPVVAASAAAPASSPSGLSPTVAWIGAGTTLALGGIAAWSTFDMTAIRREFNAAGCDAEGSEACSATASAGRAADTRTVVLWTATGIAAIATLVTAAFFVRWRSVDVGMVPLGGGALVSLRVLE